MPEHCDLPAPQHATWRCSRAIGHPGVWHRHELPDGKVAFWQHPADAPQLQVW
jgi:hypothetical protein